jgi:hypothetical protein
VENIFFETGPEIEWSVEPHEGHLVRFNLPEVKGEFIIVDNYQFFRETGIHLPPEKQVICVPNTEDGVRKGPYVAITFGIPNGEDYKESETYWHVNWHLLAWMNSRRRQRCYEVHVEKEGGIWNYCGSSDIKKFYKTVKRKSKNADDEWGF